MDTALYVVRVYTPVDGVVPNDGNCSFIQSICTGFDRAMDESFINNRAWPNFDITQIK
jgi:hypothetical protein